MFENDHIRVLEYRLKSGQHVATSLDGDCLMVPLTAAMLLIDGGAVRSLAEHEIYASTAGIHRIEAADGPDIWLLLVQFKGPGPSEPPRVADDNAMLVEPEAYRLIFENRRARIAWVTSAPGDKTKMHSHPAHVFRYLISPNIIRTIDADGTSRDVDLKAGAVTWRDSPMHHETENVGETTGQLVLIEVR